MNSIKECFPQKVPLPQLVFSPLILKQNQQNVSQINRILIKRPNDLNYIDTSGLHPPTPTANALAALPTYILM